MNIVPSPSLPSSSTPTSHSNVLAVLAAKRAELDARRLRLSEQVADLERELALLDGTIRLFAEAEGSIASWQCPPSRLRTLPDFRRGEIGGVALAVLREAAHPLSTQEVGHAFCARRSLVLEARPFKELCLRVVTHLRSAEKQGLIRAVGRTRNGAVLWFASS